MRRTATVALASGLLYPHRRALLGAVLCLGGAGALTLLYPWLAGSLAAGLLGSGDAESLPLPAIATLWVALAIGQGALAYAGVWLGTATSESIMSALRDRVFEAYLAMSPANWPNQTQGDRLARLSNDTALLGHVLGGTLPAVLPLLVTSVGALIVIVFQNAAAAFVLVLSITPIFLLVRWLGGRVRRATRTMLDAQSALFEYVDEQLGTLPVIKAFAVERWSLGGFGDINEQLRCDRTRALRRQGLIAPLSRSGGTIALLAILGLLAVPGTDSTRVADLTESLLYGFFVVRPLSAASNLYGNYQQARAALARIIDALASASPTLVDSLEKETAFSGAHGDEQCGDEQSGLVIRDLAFDYADRPSLISHVGFSIAPGEIILVHGDNGSGKSTLAALLLRFLEPAHGSLILDGVSHQEWEVREWRRQFGYVPQQPLLFNGTIRENITLGRKVSEDELAQAVQAANAAKMLAALPAGLETSLHDRGTGLSGGQQQRLALARAIVAQPRFLILDEATSMLDPHSVRVFVDQVRVWGAGCGILLISHDSSLHTLADRIYELRAGVLQSGALQ